MTCPEWCDTNTGRRFCSEPIPKGMACNGYGGERHRCYCSVACMASRRALHPAETQEITQVTHVETQITQVKPK